MTILKGKVVAVTGASSGIGRALSARTALHGWTIYHAKMGR